MSEPSDTAQAIPGRIVRKLVVTLHADVQGYSRLLGEKDTATLQILTPYLELIDAVQGQHLWSERYDRPLQDIFAVQDDIRQQIVFALKVKLTPGEQARRDSNKG